VKNIEIVIDLFKRGELRFKRDSQNEQYLYDFFDIDPNIYEDKSIEYCPSKKIAETILFSKKQFSIDSDNKFLMDVMNNSAFANSMAGNVCLLIRDMISDGEINHKSLDIAKKFFKLVSDREVSGLYSNLERALLCGSFETVREILPQITLLMYFLNDP
jgi:hypothetical protein